MSVKYVYNINCVNYLIRHGAICTGTGINKNSRKTYWTFDYKQCQDAYNKWNKHKAVKEIMKEINLNYERKKEYEDRKKNEQVHISDN